MPEGDSSSTLLETIETEHLRLFELLAGAAPARLAERPRTGRWSVVENVRHLIFAEQLHLGRLLEGGPQWCALGLPPPGLQPRFPMVGTPTGSVDEVIAAWQRAHDPMRQLALNDTREVRSALEKNLRHLRSHITVVERMLRARHADHR